MLTEDEIRDPQLHRRVSAAAYLRAATAKAAAGIADLIIPPACLACHEPLGEHNAVCASCWNGINFIRPPLCDRLGLPMPFDSGGTIISARAAADPPLYDRARAVAHFSGVMRDMILVFKYADAHNARRLFGRWLTSAGAELIADCDIIAPVPMHPRRLFSRRYNQAAILAREIAKTSGHRYEPILINRIRHTESQAGLTSRDQRRRNLAGAFAASPRQQQRIAGRKILLIDDVITTGTTLNACARVLRRAGAARIDALALAIVTDDSQITL